MQRFIYFYFLVTLLTLGSCAKKNFFQQSALAGPVTQEERAKWDSAVVIAGEHYDRGLWHRLWWGTHYRKVWAQPVTLPVLDLKRMHGGLNPQKLGGGFQTTSLTLENEKGREYALRSVDKDPKDILPKGLQRSFITNLLRDQTSAGLPYGAAVVSVLSGGVKIPHSHPRYVYIPLNIEKLENISPDFEDKVFLLEEKFEGKEAITRYLGKAKNLVDSEEFLKNRFSKHSHLPDQVAFAKARLFDVYIGDWDRHEGQWQWAVYDSGAVTSYAPVPKDRDQAFFKFDDGIVPWLFSRRWAPLRKMKTFHANVTSVKGYLQNAQFIDERCLNEITLEQWQTLAQTMQTQLTDSLLEAAVNILPTEVYKLTGQDLLKKLKARRAQLPKIARHMYHRLSEHVMVPGTDEKEKFVVERLANGDTRVLVLQENKEKSEKSQLVYDRVFKKSETKSIILHGLADKDEFIVSGETNRSIQLHIYGGMGEDEVKDTSKVKGWGKKTRVYDTKQGVIAEEKGKETKIIKSKTVDIHAFDREGL